MDNNTIQSILANALPDADISVSGDGYHIDISVFYDDFEGKSKVAQQQQLYQILGPHIQSGEIHAVNLTTGTRDNTHG